MAYEAPSSGPKAVVGAANADEALEGKGTVTVRTRAEQDEAVLEVEDDGPGIPEDARGRIFEPYVTTKSGGSGLGLAIAARICTEHGGRLELAQKKTPGALFRVFLPAKKLSAYVEGNRAAS